MNKNIRKAIGILAVIVGIVIIIPAVYAEDLNVAQDFQYPLGDGSLEAWNSFIEDHSFGFGKWNGAFSSYHLGQDTRVDRTPTDTKFFAVADGIVRISDNKQFGGYGNYYGKGYAVVIEHKLDDGNIVTSLYGHVQPGSGFYNEEDESGLIPVGSTVHKGQYLGKVADYLMESGSNWHHLHFGVRKGQYIEKKYSEYIKGYNSSGWNVDHTVHDTWYNPNDFILKHLPPSIDVISPNGGEKLPAGSEQMIQWKFTNMPISSVKIELQKGPSFLLKETIALFVPTDYSGEGSYLWKIPLDQNIGTDYKIIITSMVNPKHTGISDGYFTIGTPPLLPKLDLIFLIDTTGSMGDDIAAVKSSASEIVEALDLKASDYRVAVADYRDYPQSPYGQPGLDYDYNLNIEFSNDKNSIINSINSLSLGYGMDWEESVFTALVKAMIDPNKDLNNEDNYGWRIGVNKAIIIMGDAPPHDPEPWVGGYTLEDVAYWSENIDPILVYSVVIGSNSATYNAFSEISERTGGKVYTSPTASDIVDTIIEVIGDIGETPNLGVSVEINPVINVVNPENAVIYSINITNTGTIADTYNISIDFENFASGYRGYPTSIQESWINLNRTSVEIEPEATETVYLNISVPNNWAGMGDVIYPFEVMAKSETDELISNTSSAELKVIANKRSMVEYSRLETIWLSELVQSSSVDDEIKNSLLDKLTSATLKLDQSILNIEGGKYKQANNMLEASQNIINAFINQVEAQYDKKIMQPDAEMLMGEANTILQDIESAQNM